MKLVACMFAGVASNLTGPTCCCSCQATKSTPVIISVMPCSTCQTSREAQHRGQDSLWIYSGMHILAAAGGPGQM